MTLYNSSLFKFIPEVHLDSNSQIAMFNKVHISYSAELLKSEFNCS